MTLSSLSMTITGVRGRPGLAPAGEVLSFASPKESTQRKGEPDSSALRCATGTLRCSERAGCAQTRPAGSNMRAPLSAHSCATRLLITAGGVEYQLQIQKGRAMARPCGVRLLDVPSPCVCAEKRSGGRIKRRACLSAASLRGSRLARASQVAPAQPGSQTPGSPFFASFLWRDKERKSPAGARPGNAAQSGHYAESKV
jgi:hypothetical protein